MSFTFRNLFSEEGGDSVPESPEGAHAAQPDQVFSAPSADGVRGSAPAPAEQEAPPERTQGFLVSELLPFIPPAIAATSGIPMEDELVIPMSADGSTDVKLSVIYQVCPQLFAAEITPLNDSTVTLPAKLEVGALSEGESDSRLSGVAFGANPFTSAEEEPQEKDQEVAAEADNPFWSPEPLNTDAKEEPAVEPKSDETPGEGDGDSMAGFSAPQETVDATPQSEVVPDILTTGFTGFGEMDTKPVGETAQGGLDNPNGFGAPSGFGAPTESPEVSPVEDTAEKAEAPAVETEQPAPFSGSAFDNPAGFSTLFTEQAQGDAEIPFPEGEQESTPTPAQNDAGDTWGTMFEAGFSGGSGDTAPVPGGFGDMLASDAKAENEGQVAEVKSEEAPTAPIDVTPVKDEAPKETAASQEEKPSDTFGFAAAQAAAETKEFEQEVAGGFDAPIEQAAPATVEDAASEPAPADGFSGFASIGPIETPVEEKVSETPEIVEVVTPEPEVEAAELEPNPFQTVEDAPAPEEEAPFAAASQGVKIQVAEHSVSQTVAVSQPVVQVKKEAVSSVPAAGFMGTSQDDADDLPDLEMRAIFSSSDTFTLSRVARKIVELPGMQGCAMATPVHLVQASRSEESRLGDEAQELVNSVKNLAKLTGLPDAKSFTLQTDRGIVSLFMEGACCLIVRHDTTEFGPGVREKLVLIARSMHKLSD